MHSNAQNAILYTLQIGRALAALMIVVHHSVLATHSAFSAMPDIYFHIGSFGYLGVDYFFVLSGFIIAHTTQNMRPDAADALRYIRARFLRIYPPYLPIGIFMLLALTLFPSLSMGGRGTVSFIGSLFLLPTNTPPALSVAWTLQHEMVFYAFFGLCFFGFKSRYVIFLWALPILLFSAVTLPRWADIFLGSINLEFLFGIAAYHAYRRGLFFVWRRWFLVFGLGLVCFASVFVFCRVFLPYERLWFGAGFAFVVLAMTLIERCVDFSRYSFLIYLGAASYSLYLIHGMTISLLVRVVHVLPYWSFAFMLFVVGSCVAGILYYRFIEKPFVVYAKKCRVTGPA